MHDTARKFVKAVAPLAHGRILEIGSRNVNGSVRYLFTGQYTGIDIREGPGVDIVVDGAIWDGDGELFDAVVCCEVLEHANDPALLCKNIMALVRRGGIIILTAATPERKPHSGIDGGDLRPDEPYQGITCPNLKAWLDNCYMIVIDDSTHGDIYALAVR